MKVSAGPIKTVCIIKADRFKKHKIELHSVYKRRMTPHERHSSVHSYKKFLASDKITTLYITLNMNNKIDYKKNSNSHF